MNGSALRCWWCGVVVLDMLVGGAWRYTCRRCRARESTTGLAERAKVGNFQQPKRPPVGNLSTGTR